MFDPDDLTVLNEAWAGALRTLAPAEDVTAPFRRWFDDPVGWAENVAGERLWRFQRALLEAARDHQRLSVRTPRRVGKTHALGALIGWFVTTRRGLVITMSAKQDALKSQLWPRLQEIKASATIALPGKLATLQWKIGPRHEVIGLTASDEGAVRGFHSGSVPPDDPDAWERELAAVEAANEAAVVSKIEEVEKLSLANARDDVWLLVILDEVQTMDDRIIQAFMGSIQGDRVRLVLSGNPLMSPEAPHEFARSFKRGSGYYRIKAAAYPVDDDVESDVAFDRVPPRQMSAKWIQERKDAWGEDSALYRSDVLGQFSSHALPNQFVTLAILRQAAERAATWKFELDVKRRHIGWDVAFSETGDDNVATFWDCGMLVREEVWKEADVTKSADKILEWREWFGIGKAPVPGRNIHVDASEGAGKTAAHYMRKLGVVVDMVDAGAAPAGDWPLACAEMLFEMRKPELLWIFRCALRDGHACVPEVSPLNGQSFERIYQQAQWYSYEFKPRKGGTVVAVRESKEDLLRVHGRSPDNFESAYNAWSRAGGGKIFGKVRAA